MNTTKNEFYLTAEGLQALKDELQDLTTVKRGDIAERLKEAKADWVEGSQGHRSRSRCLMSELTYINCVALTARFPVGKPVVPAALMNRPTRGERRFAYWALFRFLAH